MYILYECNESMVRRRWLVHDDHHHHHHRGGSGVVVAVAVAVAMVMVVWVMRCCEGMARIEWDEWILNRMYFGMDGISRKKQQTMLFVFWKYLFFWGDLLSSEERLRSAGVAAAAEAAIRIIRILCICSTDVENEYVFGWWFWNGIWMWSDCGSIKSG